MTPDITLDAVAFAKSYLGFQPDPVQSQVLDTRIWRGILNCTRQWGKSTIMAIKALHEALTIPDTTVLVLCPSKHQAGEFFEAVRSFMHTLGLRPRGDGHNTISIRLLNGSRIVGISSNSRIRGYRKVSLLLVDEAAEVREESYQVIRPALATTGEFGGKIWMMSTPQGTQGMFWRTWHTGGHAWSRFKATAADCPRISRHFLEEERINLGEHVFRQEYMCEFISPPDCFLNREVIWAALSHHVPPVWQ